MPKSIPLRMCCGCRTHRPKNELVRVVRSPEGEVSLDLTGRKNGRGAYVCPNCSCLQKAQKQRALERALQSPVSEELFQLLLQQMQEGAT